MRTSPLPTTRFAWQSSIRFVGWLDSAITGLVLAAFIVAALGAQDEPRRLMILTVARAVEAVIPLSLGIQAALAFSPDDEPALEVLLVCPRPLAWLLLERLTVILLPLMGLALIGTIAAAALSGETNIALALMRWPAPTVFFGGVAVYVTLRSRQPSFSIAVVIIIWFITGFLGPALLPGQPTLKPLDIIQPYVWIIHPYLQPHDLSVADYTSNRVVLIAAGISLLLLALQSMRDEEKLLLGSQKSRKGSFTS
jgi:hypothetical protein